MFPSLNKLGDFIFDRGHTLPLFINHIFHDKFVKKFDVVKKFKLDFSNCVHDFGDGGNTLP